MNLNGILIGSQDPQRLTAYYTMLFGETGWSGGDFRGWQLGGGYVTTEPEIRPTRPAGPSTRGALLPSEQLGRA